MVIAFYVIMLLLLILLSHKCCFPWRGRLFGAVSGSLQLVKLPKASSEVYCLNVHLKVNTDNMSLTVLSVSVQGFKIHF